MDADEIRVVQYLAQFEFLFELGEDRLMIGIARSGDDFVAKQFQRKGLPGPFLDHFEHIADLAGRNVGDHGELVDFEYVVGHWVRPAVGVEKTDLSRCRIGLWPFENPAYERSGNVSTGARAALWTPSDSTMMDVPTAWVIRSAGVLTWIDEE